MKDKQRETKLSPTDYFATAKAGTIVAFKANVRGHEQTLSGMIICDVEDKKEVQTKNGTYFLVGPEDVVWVKTGSRWPSWVFEQFKDKTK